MRVAVGLGRAFFYSEQRAAGDDFCGVFVFDTAPIAAAVPRPPAHFPKPAKPEPTAAREPVSISQGTPQSRPACSTTLGGAEAPPSPNLRCGKMAGGAEPDVATRKIIANL